MGMTVLLGEKRKVKHAFSGNTDNVSRMHQGFFYQTLAKHIYLWLYTTT